MVIEKSIGMQFTEWLKTEEVLLRQPGDAAATGAEDAGQLESLEHNSQYEAVEVEKVPDVDEH